MKVYLVGGAVRDKLLGLKPQDLDYVVMESSEEELLSLGFRKVGLHFSIFIHPQSGDEYALPRGQTLEEDLSKRDLTINAMALSDTGEVIDLFNGRRDLQAKILRHASCAFLEDPLRVFRVYRFLTVYPDFQVAPETLALMKTLIKAPEFKQLSPERVFQELKHVLACARPSVFFEGLRSMGGLEFYFEELKDCSDWDSRMRSLDSSVDLLVKYAILAQGTGLMGPRLLVPNDWAEAASTYSRFRLRVERIGGLLPEELVNLYYEMDAFRKPNLVQILGHLSQKLIDDYKLIKDISAKDVAPNHSGKAIGEAIREKRIEVLKARGR